MQASIKAIIIGLVSSAALLIIFSIPSLLKVDAQNSEIQTKRFKPELVVQSGHKGMILSVAFSPDGKMLASAGEDIGIKLWNVETGKELRTLYGHRSTIRSIVFSADGKKIA